MRVVGGGRERKREVGIHRLNFMKPQDHGVRKGIWDYSV